MSKEHSSKRNRSLQTGHTITW